MTDSALTTIDRTTGRGALAGKRALVIGASSGIGLESSRILLGDGAHVLLTARDETRLRSAEAELKDAAAAGSGSVDAMVCDGMRGSEIEAAVERAAGDGGLHIAVAIPGGGGFCPVLGYEDERFRDEVNQNVFPAFLAIKYAGLAMVRSGGGSIVLTSSTAAIMSSAYLSAYCAGKAAVDQLVRVAADELGELGVRVNAVRPGLTRTGGTGALFDNEAIFSRFVEQQPLPKGGRPEYIARAVRFLAGPEASWVTGQSITVDGGHTIRRFPDLSDLTRQITGDELWEGVRRGRLP